jgi:hypothetical protein
VRDYLPFITGAGIGLLVSFIFYAILGLSGIPQLLLFGLTPALCGAVVERLVLRRSSKR